MDLVGWILGGAAVSGIAAYLFGITLVLGTTTIIAFPAGIIAALVAIGTVAVLTSLVSVGWCCNRCSRQQIRR